MTEFIDSMIEIVKRSKEHTKEETKQKILKLLEEFEKEHFSVEVDSNGVPTDKTALLYDEDWNTLIKEIKEIEEL